MKRVDQPRYRRCVGIDRLRAFIAIPGIWTDAWFEAPDAWWAWVCAWSGWTFDDWCRYRATWARSNDSEREALTLATGIRFFDWRRLPGGSTRASVDAAVEVLEHHLSCLAPGTDVTLVGHSKGGNVVKALLQARQARQPKALVPPGAILDDRLMSASPNTGVTFSPVTIRAAIICAPVDVVRERIGAALGFGLRPISWQGTPDGVQVATITNLYDPSGGRLHGVPNYHVRIWNDHFIPWPPHGMKSGLARQVLADLGAVAIPSAHVAS